MSRQSSSITAPLALPDLDIDLSKTTVLCVDDDEEFLDFVETLLDGDDRFEIRTETDPEAALQRLDGVDCVVSNYEMPGLDGHDLLDEVRTQQPDLPFVLLTGSPRPGVLEPVLSRDWTDYLGKQAAVEATDLLPDRVQRLTELRHVSTLTRRALAAVDAAEEGIAIVAPDGTFTFVDRQFADQFGYDREALVGRSWRDVYTDDAVDRIESNALAAVEEGWRWSGNCTGRRRSDETFTSPTAIAGLEDGSLVLFASEAV